MPKQSLIYILFGFSLALNVVLLLNRGPSAPDQVAPAAEVTDEELTPRAAAPKTKADDDASEPDAASEPRDEGTAAGRRAAAAGDWEVLRADVKQSLARTFQIEAGEDGDALASVYTRLFVWDLDMRRDLQNGDAVAVVWREGPDGFPEIAGANLSSKKLGRTVTAYRWKAPDDQFASYWHPDGTEAALRLKEGPLKNYEQITSLLKDRPSHKGMDFKTPVGTEVVSPRAGTVTRVNWNWNANGNCVEIRFEDGVLAKFLHLSENKVKEGDRVAAGQVVALTGNTGRSTAPHLHYQLDRGEKTLDPLDYHGTERRSLSPDQLAAMKRDVAELDKTLAE
ncbi:MAG TPA: M23 family metallopeptidase [Candidatus Binatia bacterium]|nr:M23 family metallopeptidase [Candidatus Binatia bacterium]